MTPFRKVKPGDQFKDTAVPWNGFIDSHRAWAEIAGGKAVDAKNIDPPKTCVTVVNSTGAARRMGEVVEIDKDVRPITSDLNDNYSLWFKALRPNGARGYGILRDHLAKDESGLEVCQIAGVCMAHVHVTDLNHRTAKITPSSHVLTSSENGPVFILWMPPDPLSEIETENVRQCAVVVNQPMQVFLAESRLTANMCTAADATIDPNEFVGFRFGQYILNPVELPDEASNAQFYGHAGQTGDKVLLLFNDHPADGEPKWIVVDVAKKEQTVVTDFTIDWEECCYTKSTRKCSVESCEDEVVGDPVCQA